MLIKLMIWLEVLYLRYVDIGFFQSLLREKSWNSKLRFYSSYILELIFRSKSKRCKSKGVRASNRYKIVDFNYVICPQCSSLSLLPLISGALSYFFCLFETRKTLVYIFVISEKYWFSKKTLKLTIIFYVWTPAD